MLFPRADATSRTEQQNQRQADIVQAQAAAHSGVETEIRRRQVAGTEGAHHKEVSEKKGGQQHLTSQDQSQDGAKRRRDSQGEPDGIQGDLGQSIDIRI